MRIRLLIALSLMAISCGVDEDPGESPLQDAADSEPAGVDTAISPENDTRVEPGDGERVDPGDDTTVGPGEDTAVGPGEDTVVDPGEDAVVDPGEDTVVDPDEDAVVDPGDDASAPEQVLPTEMVGWIKATTQVTGTAIDVSWALPIADPILAKVFVYRKQGDASTGPGDGDMVYSGLGEVFADDTLTTTGTYYYTAYTCNSEDQCMPEGMTASDAVVFAPQEPITNFAATTTANGIDLTWDAPTGDPAYDHVRIRRQVDQEPGLEGGEQIYKGTEEVYGDTPPYDGTWHYTAVSCNSKDVCAASGVSASATLDLNQPVPVLGFSALAGDNKVELTWDANEEPDHGGVKICRSSPDCSGMDTTCAPIHTAAPADTSYTDNEAQNLSEYCYRAYAFDLAGSFAAPAEVHVVPNDGNPFWWSYTVGGGAHDHVQRLHVTSDGGLLVSAMHNIGGTAQQLAYQLPAGMEEVDFGGGPVPFVGYDMILVKLDQDGDYLWHWVPYQQCDCDTFINGIGTDAEDNIYLGGVFGNNTIQFDASLPVETSTTVDPNFDKDAFIVKLDKEGVFQWVHVYKGKGGEKAFGMDTSPAGDSFLCGKMTNKFDFGDGSFNSKGEADVFLASRDKDNNLNWGWTVGANGSEQADACIEHQGDVYVAGAYKCGALAFGGGERHGKGGNDLFVVGLDGQGDYQWDYVTLTGNGEERAASMVNDAAGDLYVVGRFTGAVDFGGGERISDEQDLFVLKLTATGNYVWDYTAGGNYNDFARDVVVTPNGLYVVGTFESDAVDFGDGPVSNAAAPIQNPGHMVEGDYFILELDPTDGTFIEVRTAVSGGTGSSMYGDDFARAVAATPSGNGIYVGGHYSDPIDFGGGLETSQGGRDIFVMKMLP